MLQAAKAAISKTASSIIHTTKCCLENVRYSDAILLSI